MSSHLINLVPFNRQPFPSPLKPDFSTSIWLFLELLAFHVLKASTAKKCLFVKLVVVLISSAVGLKRVQLDCLLLLLFGCFCGFLALLSTSWELLTLLRKEKTKKVTALQLYVLWRYIYAEATTRAGFLKGNPINVCPSRVFHWCIEDNRGEIIASFIGILHTCHRIG